MGSEEELARQLRDIEERWNQITATPTPPRSLMNVIQYGLGDKKRGEVYVTRLLRYLLDPSEPHGLDTRFLKAFLDEIATNFGFEEPLYDLSDIRVRDEVWIRLDADDRRPTSEADFEETAEADGDTPAGRVDLVIDKPGEWFLLVELKFSAEENNLAGEGLSQTEFYRTATHIGETPKAAYENGSYYIYLHTSDSNTAADKQQFVNWTWKAVTTDVIQPFINTEGPSVPHRTFVQLNELQDDIREFTDMTPHEPNVDEKVELYFEYYALLNDLQQSFESRWDEFTNQWHTNVAEALVEFTEATYEVDDGIVAVDLAGDRPNDTWYLRATHKDWQQLYKEGWWKPENEEQWNQDVHELESLYKKAAEYDTLRIFYHHRMDTNRDAAIEDNTLIFTFRNAGANPKPFYDIYSENCDERADEILDALPESATWLGHKSNQFEVRYEIPEPDPNTDSAPDDFFEAYTATVRTAFVELVVENPGVTNILTEIYDEAVSEHMDCI